MSIARRAFLQFTAGAVGGTLLSPLPWKLADDSAIWSQNWSWRPSPERGAITKTTSVCTLCGGACGIQVRLVGKKRAILIEGNPDHPINRGGICPLGAAGLQLLYAPYRIPHPMRQTKKRGDVSGFQKITWEEAINELGGKLLKLRTEGKPNSLASITTGRSSSMDDLWQQFFTAYGSANLFRMPSHADSLRLAALVTTGQDNSIAFAMENAAYILSFGANLIDGWGESPCRMQSAFRNWHEGIPAKLVQIESRCSLTAAKADRWIAVAPGTESALALAIANVMIRENLFDAAFVAGNVFGFEDWTDTHGKGRMGFKNLVLSLYAPEQVAQQTGVEPTAIRELAREFAAQTKAIALWGSRSDMPSNIYTDLSFLALNILKGNLASGGMINLSFPTPLDAMPGVQPDGIAQKGLAQKRVDLAVSKPAPFPGNNLHSFLDTVAKGNSYPIDLLMIYEANPAYNLPENQLFLGALAKIGTLVSFSSYMDETAMQADLILPNHMALERYDDVTGILGAPYGYYAVAAPILQPQLETKHTGDILIQLSKAIGGSMALALPWESYETLLKERVNSLAANKRGAVADQKDLHLWKLLPGQSPEVNYTDGADLWNKLASGLCWYDAPMDLLQSIKTQSGRIELAFQIIEGQGLVVEQDQIYLPHFAPLPPSGTEQEYPLQLLSYKSPTIATGYQATPPFMMKLIPSSILKANDLYVELHPQTAHSLGLTEGNNASLRTPQGELPVRIHLFPGARPGVVYIVEGLGHTAYDQYIQNKGVNAMDLIEVQMDPITGLGTVWSTRAHLRRI